MRLRLVLFVDAKTERAPRVGILTDKGILDPAAAWDPARGPFPPDAVAVIASDPARLHCEQILRDPTGVPSYAQDEVRLAAPLPRPNSFRDFYAFEEHVRNARARRGLAVPEEWGRIPVFYFSNHGAIFGPEEKIRAPRATRQLDFELEIGCVIGRPGRDIPVKEASGYIAGYCVLNDWSARDIQAEEMKVGLGPAKGKDFATSIGPALVTPDEIDDARSGKGYDLAMTARRNGRLISRGSWKSIHWSFEEMIARASCDVRLRPGDLLGSGTVGTGCILELGPEAAGGWLEAGDRIDLEIERLGLLSNTIA
jgi:2-keto-4-pentenoate hydratase/2-oxohepta-3-ene-1,7-dioic acid hydratase in catechol pathway